VETFYLLGFTGLIRTLKAPGRSSETKPTYNLVMPIYEYRCARCGKKESKFWRSLSAINEAQLTCSHCGSSQMSRLVSRVRVLRGGGESEAPGPDGDLDASLMREMENLDENDPRALGRFMRKMAAETGESLGEEFDEVVGRLEKGEDPEKIERDMGELFGGGDGAANPDAPQADAATADADAGGATSAKRPARSNRTTRKPTAQSTKKGASSTKTKRKK